nr:hypothetical protein [Tanacetum cinerariifolium]
MKLTYKKSWKLYEKKDCTPRVKNKRKLSLPYEGGCVNLQYSFYQKEPKIWLFRVMHHIPVSDVFLCNRARIIAVHLNDVALGRENMYKRDKGQWTIKKVHVLGPGGVEKDSAGVLYHDTNMAYPTNVYGVLGNTTTDTVCYKSKCNTTYSINEYGVFLPWSIHGARILGYKVKNKRENEKIETKPDKIKKKREAWKSPEVSKTNHILMSTFVLCVGCGEPLYGFSPCRWCTCEWCGIDMLNGICPLCHLSNSCTYDHNPNSFDFPPDSYHHPHPTYETYSGDTRGNDSHFSYDYPPRFPLNYKPEPGYIQNYNSYPQDSPSFPQQYPCCEDCGVTHEPYQCQPKNHDYYHEQNFCCDSNSIGFDQSQPQQYTVNHPIFNAHHDLLGSQKKLNITLTKVNEQMTSLTSMCELACQIVLKNLEEKQLEEEQAAKAQNWKLPVCYDDDDDEESSNSLEDNIIFELLLYSAVTPSEPSCVENLVPNPSESDGENECDVPDGFTTFSNVLFNADYDFDSGDDRSTFDEDFPKKIYSNLLFDEEINPMKIDQHSFNAESDLIESMPNHDSSIIISLKIDSLFDEFAGELTLLKLISPGIDETDCHHEKETRFAKRLLYDNSSPHQPEETIFDNSNADIESFSPSPIPVGDSDSHMEEIVLPFTPDDPMPPSIEDGDYDSGRDIPILEELLDNYSLSLPANESYHFDIPSPYRPPAKPPDGNTRTLNIKIMGDVSDQKVPIHGLTITRILNQEKSPDLLSHQGLEAFQPSAECPMIINGKNISLFDVPLFHFYPP